MLAALLLLPSYPASGPRRNLPFDRLLEEALEFAHDLHILEQDGATL